MGERVLGSPVEIKEVQNASDAYDYCGRVEGTGGEIACGC